MGHRWGSCVLVKSKSEKNGEQCPPSREWGCQRRVEDPDEPGKVSSLRALRAHQAKQNLLSASMFLRKVK